MFYAIFPLFTFVLFEEIHYTKPSSHLLTATYFILLVIRLKIAGSKLLNMRFNFFQFFMGYLLITVFYDAHAILDHGYYVIQILINYFIFFFNFIRSYNIFPFYYF